MNSESNEESISIGMPVYNGEKFLRTRLNSILNQSFSDFELIISDNASTDDTPKICEEYTKTDKRIRYIRHEKNMGPLWNYNYVLEQAKNEYFVWAAVDDIWKSTFLKKNLDVLISNQNVFGCMSKVSFHDYETLDLNSNKTNLSFRNFLIKLRQDLKPADIYPLFGSYEKKVRQFLKKSLMKMFYGIFRTNILQKSMATQSFVGVDHAILLNALRYGDFFVINENLMSFFIGGLSKKGIISVSKQFNKGTFGIIFPMYPLTKWCFKNLGKSIFFKNIDYFIQLNLWGGFSLVLDLFRHFLNMLYKK